jgi:SCP-2 sterol transfer family
MSAFRDSTHAAEVLGGFYEQESHTDDGTFAGSGLVIAYTLRDPDVRLVLDARKKPEPGRMFDFYVNDPNAPEPTVDFLMDAETFDKLHRGEVQAMMLMMSGKVKAKGDVTAAMRLLPALARAIPRYKKYRDG